MAIRIAFILVLLKFFKILLNFLTCRLELDAYVNPCREGYYIHIYNTQYYTIMYVAQYCLLYICIIKGGGDYLPIAHGMYLVVLMELGLWHRQSPLVEGDTNPLAVT